MRHQVSPLFCSLLVSLVLLVGPAWGDGNLLRNGDFQDDWLTLLPELKNHHWNYTTEVYNRRDYNPDGWRLSGTWRWLDADQPRGRRRLTLASPSRAVQSVNWVTINNPSKLEGWPDAGGYPAAEAVRSKNPLALVSDLTFRVRLSADNLPAQAATVIVAWNGASPVDDPLGTKRIVAASAPVPAGTYRDQWIEVKLPASAWLETARKDPAFASQGALIPMGATCEIAVADKHSGSIELHEATLEIPARTGNLLPNGGFEELRDGRPSGWSGPRKYRSFPPGIYYIFNTWHNSNSDNRGSVAVDSLIPHRGRNSLRMVVPSGDEVCVVSDPVPLGLPEAQFIEVRAWIKTDRLCMMQIDAEDEIGRRLDGFNFIHKNPLSIGTNDWRLVRQVFRPTEALKSIRVKLCARGMNGYTLDDTGHQPQQNAAGVIWWDDVAVYLIPNAPDDPPRGRPVNEPDSRAGPRLEHVDLGEVLLGRNELTAELVNPGPDGSFRVALDVADGDDVRSSQTGTLTVRRGERVRVAVPYTLSQPDVPYSRRPARLRLVDADGRTLASSDFDLSTWTVPIDLELGALYLRPNQKQFVRVTLGLTAAEMARVQALRVEVLRRGTGESLHALTLPATLAAIERQRTKIPDGLRDDFRNLLLKDLDVAFLPVQPFHDPQRNWLVRVTTIDVDGKPGWSMTSPPFCRLAHDEPQPPIQSVRINADGDFLINDKPWIPWGVTYGHNPVYDGPAEADKYHDLANLSAWSLYDRHGGNLGERSLWDGNCLRLVEGPKIGREQLEAMWKKNLYASTVFLPPRAHGPWPKDLLDYLRTAPMVASVSRGPEEAFGYFTPLSQNQIDDLKSEVEELRRATNKPVMVGHGGYWNRLEFERVPFFDIYDPETEPLYPAPLHTDMKPLFAGKGKVVWLRPQMYESVPYERWRYHVYVELIRGARGWQVAHGPGDASTFRGLHAELKRLQPALYSKERPPDVTIQPPLEHLVRRQADSVLIIAASTHGMSFGQWRPAGLVDGKAARVTADPSVVRAESDGSHAASDANLQLLVPHGIQYLIEPKAWPAGSKLVTWIKLDPKAQPRSLLALVKADGRWTHAASWGPNPLPLIRSNNRLALWFLRTFYRHAPGFLGWGEAAPPYALAYLPAEAADMGDPPTAGDWVKLEVPLQTLHASGKLLDGVAFAHHGGRVWWSDTALVSSDGKEEIVFGVHEDRPAPETLAAVRIQVAGLKKGTRVRVLFEDRQIIAEDGYFVDDFRGVDLYQRYGGERSGYGNAPVALHIYEVPVR